MINKNLRKSSAHRNGNGILVCRWNNPHTFKLIEPFKIIELNLTELPVKSISPQSSRVHQNILFLRLSCLLSLLNIIARSVAKHDYFLLRCVILHTRIEFFLACVPCCPRLLHAHTFTRTPLLGTALTIPRKLLEF